MLDFITSSSGRLIPKITVSSRKSQKGIAENHKARTERPTSGLTACMVLFLGYPNWWGTMPMPVWTFLEDANVQDLKIAPFCTNEGSGMGRSEKDLAKLCPDAEILPGLAITGHEAANSNAALEVWLRKLGILNK